MKYSYFRRICAAAAAVLAAACADSRAVTPLAGPDGAASHLVGGPGTVTLCKVTGDPAQTFNFDVDVNFADATTSASLTVGQCSQIYLGQTAFIDVTENNGSPDSIIAFVPGSASSADTVYAYGTNTTEIIARPTLAWTINVYNPVPVVVTPPSANCVSIVAVQNVAITPVTLTASGGSGGPYTFTATGLPAGLSISTGGTISGTPTATGTFPYTVTITDKNGHVGTLNCSVTVNGKPTASCIAISAVMNVAITPVTLSGSGGTGGPYTFSATGLPAGLTMSVTGTISGIPTVSGTFSYAVVVTDNGGHSGTFNCSVTVAPGGSALTTYTQGGWGTVPHGGNPGSILAANFAKVYPGGSVSIGGGTYTLTFTSQVAVQNFLPAGSTPGVLKASATNPTSSAAGVFAGQVLALRLSVDFSNSGVTKGGLATRTVKSGKLAGYTVAQVLSLANSVIGGNTGALPAGMSVSDLNDVVNSINNNYDNGTSNGGYLM